MPRANRYHLPGHVWHLTHRCHEREFLLKFTRDRDRYRHWLFEARKRFGLCVLDFAITSNHVHLLVKDTAPSVIARSLQLVAGRTAQEYNQRKGRKGAYWEDRYHATAVQADGHLARCMAYIDLTWCVRVSSHIPQRGPMAAMRRSSRLPRATALSTSGRCANCSDSVTWPRFRLRSANGSTSR